jgi:hypothetical protein
LLTARSARILRAFGLLVLVACAGRRRAEPPAEPKVANCQGRAYLEVTNTLSESIDVYIGQSPRTFLGTAGPGTTRLPVENWRGTFPTFADHNGGAIVGRAVQSTYVCETP